MLKRHLCCYTVAACIYENAFGVRSIYPDYFYRFETTWCQLIEIKRIMQTLCDARLILNICFSSFVNEYVYNLDWCVNIVIQLCICLSNVYCYLFTLNYITLHYGWLKCTIINRYTVFVLPYYQIHNITEQLWTLNYFILIRKHIHNILWDNVRIVCRYNWVGLVLAVGTHVINLEHRFRMSESGTNSTRLTQQHFLFNG